MSIKYIGTYIGDFEEITQSANIFTRDYKEYYTAVRLTDTDNWVVTNLYSSESIEEPMIGAVNYDLVGMKEYRNKK